MLNNGLVLDEYCTKKKTKKRSGFEVDIYMKVGDEVEIKNDDREHLYIIVGREKIPYKRYYRYKLKQITGVPFPRTVTPKYRASELRKI